MELNTDFAWNVRATYADNLWRASPSVRIKVPVLERSLSDGTSKMGPRDWLRLALGSDAGLSAGANGARPWVKIRHLHDVIAS